LHYVLVITTKEKVNYKVKKDIVVLVLPVKVLIPEDQQKLDNDGYLFGIMPNNQLNTPKWLKDIDYDFFNKTGNFLHIK
jgi:hypothetical protein